MVSIFCVFGLVTAVFSCDDSDDTSDSDDPPCIQIVEEPELDIRTFAMSDRNFNPGCDTLLTDKIGIHTINVDGKGTESLDIEAEVQVYTLDEHEKDFCINGADISVSGLDEQLTYIKAGTDDYCKEVLLNVENNRVSDSEIKIGCIETATNSHQDVKLDYTDPENKLEFDIFSQTIYSHEAEKDGAVNQVYYRGLIQGSKINP